MSASSVFSALKFKGLMLATAESCTGGMIAAAITDIAGSSEVFDCGFITYSNAGKVEMLGIAAEIIEKHGAVSREVAEAMAAGALARSKADVVVSVTGIAGPTGGSATKPVGLVHLACGVRERKMVHAVEQFGNIGRPAIRLATRERALDLVQQVILHL